MASLPISLSEGEFVRGLLLSLLIGVSAPAAAVDCSGFLVTIPRTVQPAYPIEVKSAGQIYTPTQSLPDLNTGNYIYLITNTGETLLANKYDVDAFRQTGRGLATHKSLLQMYFERTGKSVEGRVVAAGEIHRAFGVTVELNNRSGNFRGDAATLAQAQKSLAVQGLAIASTQVRAIDPSKPEDLGHTPEDRDKNAYHLEIMASVAALPQGPRLIALFERFGRLVGRTFPAASDPTQATVQLMHFAIRGATLSGKYNGLSTFFYPIRTAMGPDGLEYGILGVFTQIESHQILPEDGLPDSVPTQISNFLLIYGSQLPPEQKAQWEALAAEFSKLKT